MNPYCTRYPASENVIESIGSNTQVIPWNRNVAAKLTCNFEQKKTWISREGIVTFGDILKLRKFPDAELYQHLWRVGRSFWFQLSLSPAGRMCGQIIASFGSLMAARIVLESRDLLRMLDRMAHEDLEVEISEE